jgi:hypothetical protein
MRRRLRIAGALVALAAPPPASADGLETYAIRLVSRGPEAIVALDQRPLA